MTIFLSVLFKLPIKRNHFHLFIYYSFFVALKEFRDNFLLYCFTRLTFHKPPEWSLIYGESVTSIVTSDYSSFSTKSSSLQLCRFKHPIVKGFRYHSSVLYIMLITMVKYIIQQPLSLASGIHIPYTHIYPKRLVPWQKNCLNISVAE